jgi:XTP/dITP diphosphohydrolase
MKCFVGTTNAGKLKELISIGQFFFPEINEWEGVSIDVEENGKSFLENAQIKARHMLKVLNSKISGSFCLLCDDSGLEVDALEGAPGIFSARYAGDHVDPQLHILKLIAALKNTPQQFRGAQYHCSLVLIKKKNNLVDEFFGEGICRGEIINEPRGLSGFGYDPIFFVTSLSKTMSELDSQTKNKISHRWNAFEDLKKKIKF